MEQGQEPRIAPEGNDLITLVQEAMRTYNNNELQASEAYCQKILSHSPRDFNGNQILGVIYARKGLLKEAAKHLRQAYDIRPDSRPVFDNLINVMHHIGNWNEVIRLLNQKINDFPNNAEFLFRRAEIEDRLGHKEEALSTYLLCLEKDKNHEAAAMRCGQIYLEQEKWQLAETYFLKIMVGLQDMVISNLETEQAPLKEGEQLPYNLDQYQKYLKCSDSIVFIRYQLWLELKEKDSAEIDIAEAKQSCEEILEATLSFAEIYKLDKPLKSQFVFVLFDALKGESKHAEEYIQLKQGSGDLTDEILCLEGDLAMRKGDLAQAESAYSKALKINNNNITALMGRGQVLIKFGRLMAASACFDRVIELKPEHRYAHLGLADIRLLNGEYEQGFKSRERRKPSEKLLRQLDIETIGLIQPHWQGIDKINGQNVILFSENLGLDYLLFSRYIPLFGDRPASLRLLFQTGEESMRPLYESYRGVKSAVMLEGQVPEADAWISLQSLPLLFGTQNPDSLPLTVAPHAIQKAKISWREKLLDRLSDIYQGFEMDDGDLNPKSKAKLSKAKAPKKKTKANQKLAPLTLDQESDGLLLETASQSHKAHEKHFWLGLCPASAELRRMQGKAAGPNLQQLCEVGGHLPNAVLVCLERNLSQEDKDYLSQNPSILYYEEEMKDYQQLASLVASLNMVIGVENNAIHFAGSLNLQAWLMLPSLPNWWWGNEGENSAWYPSFRLYRCQSSWDWNDLIMEIIEDIAYEKQSGMFQKLMLNDSKDHGEFND